MQAPNVRTTMRDPENDMTYHVLAYRSLTTQEMLQAIAQYHRQPSVRRRKKPLRGKVVTIVSILGATPSL